MLRAWALRPRIFVGFTVLFSCLGIVSARVLIDGRQALDAAQAALARGDTRTAIFELQRAAQAYLPFGPYHPVAFDRLFELGTSAESAQDATTARLAYQAFRAAALGTRTLDTPEKTRLLEVETRLARFYARADEQGSADSASPDAASTGQGDRAPDKRVQPAPETVAFFLERLGQRPGPNLTQVLLALAGFLLWTGAVVAFVLFGLDAELALRKGPALVSACGFVAGLALFFVGLRG